MRAFIDYLHMLLPEIDGYQPLKKPYYQLIGAYLNKCLHVLYNHQNEQIGAVFTELIFKIMDLVVRRFDSVLNDDYDKAMLADQINVLKLFFGYVKDNLKFKHRVLEQAKLSVLLTND